MSLLDVIREAASDLRSAKLRSLLTSLGIIIGIASVVVLLSLGEGVRATVTGAFADLGSTRITVSAAAPGRGSGGPFVPVASTLTLDDVAAVEQLPGVEAVAPLLQAVARVESLTVARDMAVTGTGPAYPLIAGQELIDGRVLAGTGEAMLSQGAVGRFFSGTGPVGQPLRVADREYVVVGVLEDLSLGFGGRGGSDGEDGPDGQGAGEGQGGRPAVYLPVADVMGLAGTDRVSQILVVATDPQVVDATVDAIDELLLARHGLDDFRVNSIAELLDSFGEIFGVVTGFLAALAGISLLVGGIGVMNIMLVVVAERTREIGIAKALGATRRDIVLQFLVEAILISLVGGLVGLLLAALGVLVIGQLLDIEAAVSGWIVALAVGVSVGIGIFFGVAPAWRAARMDPITALRHE